MTGYKIIKPEELNENVFKLIGTDWLLITAGDIESFNTMTASWGGLGVLWHKNVCFIFIRPNRYTYEFVENYEFFTLSFFNKEYKSVLDYCGSKSGRDVNKVKETGITPVETDNRSVSFEESRLIIECKKIYFQDLIPDNFLDPGIDKNYPKNDYHRMYIGEVENCYLKKV